MNSAWLEEGAELIRSEAILLDSQRWPQWLELYTADCTYWVPARRSDETLTDDPEAELSHIYYASRAGLEDRLLRIQSGRSAASTPVPRTTHLLSSFASIELPVDGSQGQARGLAQGERMALRYSWATHVYFVRTRSIHVFFGHSECGLVKRDGAWKIASKKVVLQNDYVPTLLDVYCF